LRAAGWRYRFTIIWDDDNVSKTTARGSVDSPSAPRVIARVEMILVMHKGDWNLHRADAHDLGHDEWLAWTNGVWRSSPNEKWMPCWRSAIGQPGLDAATMRCWFWPSRLVFGSSELAGLTCADVVLGVGAHVHCVGKGRKERRTPLVRQTVQVLHVWLSERKGSAHEPLFPTVTGNHLSRDALEHRIAHYVAKATMNCPSMRTKQVTTHTLRHTAAMRLLLSGVDITVTALWLGHEQVSTTTIYLHADMQQKERAIARITPPSTKPGRYRPADAVLAFLEAL
jgi:hypothetical protein